MKVFDITKIIENIAPISLAEEWDNVGLLVGSFDDEVKGIVVCLDLTESVINECISKNYNLIITHHPAIFAPLKQLNKNDYTSNLICKCIKNNINVYSAHTNMDMSDKGINFEMAKLLGIECKRFLSDGLGIFGEFDDNIDKILLKLTDITNEKEFKVYMSNSGKKLKKHQLAYISGSGGRIEEIVKTAIEKEITLIISSEFKHNILLELMANDISVIQMGHFESEIIFVDIIYNLLKDIINDIYKHVNFN